MSVTFDATLLESTGALTESAEPANEGLLGLW